MKIGIPLSYDKRLLAFDFSTGHHFGVYNTESKNLVDYSENELYGMFPGKSFLEILKILGIETVLSPNYSVMSLKVFGNEGVKTYKAHDNDIINNLDKLQQNKLALATMQNIERTTNCSSDACLTCNSNTCG